MENKNSTLYIATLVVLCLGFGTLVFQYLEKPKEADWVELQASPTQQNLNTPYTQDENVTIYLSGAVKKPGIYSVDPKKRLLEILKKLGGTTADADLEKVNLASFPKDGQHIRIPTKKSRSTHSNKRYFKQHYSTKRQDPTKKIEDANPPVNDAFRKRAFHYSSY